jgi:hypothetical protein
MPQPPSRSIRCKIEGCVARARQRGRCKKHYRLWRKENPIPSQTREPENRKEIRASPYWYLWASRKAKGQLCDEWLNTDNFARSIHPRPKNHTLCRLDPKKPFGPDNFVWRPKVKRIAGESMTDYAFRLRVEQLSRFPDFERDRQLMKCFGITQDQYDQMLKAQNGVCAICKRPETSKGRTNKIKCLSVDHCHETGKIRGLLCFFCNTGMGKLGDSIERIEAVLHYLKKHAQSAPDLRIIGGTG